MWRRPTHVGLDEIVTVVGTVRTAGICLALFGVPCVLQSWPPQPVDAMVRTPPATVTRKPAVEPSVAQNSLEEPP